MASEPPKIRDLQKLFLWNFVYFIFLLDQKEGKLSKQRYL